MEIEFVLVPYHDLSAIHIREDDPAYPPHQE